MRRDLKDSIAGQLFPLDLDTTLNNNNLRTQNDNLDVVKNLEQQFNLMKKERENAMQMWHNALGVITQLEQELKVEIDNKNFFISIKKIKLF